MNQTKVIFHATQWGGRRFWQAWDNGLFTFTDESSAHGMPSLSTHDGTPPRGLIWQSVFSGEEVAEPIECCDRPDPPEMAGPITSHAHAKDRIRVLAPGRIGDLAALIYDCRVAMGDSMSDAMIATLTALIGKP